MHTQVLDWVGQFRTLEDLSVLDIGGRDLNGSTRMFFPNANPYHVLDILPGDGVDFVHDAADWEPGLEPRAIVPGYDLVLSTETFEHAKRWPEIIATAWKALRPGGWFIFTCAGPGRPAHSGVAAVWELSPGEWYGNVSAEEIREVLHVQGWEGIEVRQFGLDTQGKAVKPLPVPPILHVEQLTEVKRGEPREVLFGAVLSRTSAGR
jgi:SAM-dependent methyltransferase